MNDGSDAVFIQEELSRLHPRQTLVPGGDWLRRLHPEDRHSWRAAVIPHLRGETEFFYGEFRMLVETDYRWVFCHGLGLRNDSGKVYRMAGSSLFTDGITEAMDKNGQLYSEERLEAVLAGYSSASARTLVQAIVDEVDRFAGKTEQADDMTMLVLRYQAVAAERIDRVR